MKVAKLFSVFVVLNIVILSQAGRMLTLPRNLSETTDYFWRAASSDSALMLKYDVKHYGLDLQLTNTSPEISGRADITFSAVSALDTFGIQMVDTVTPGQDFLVCDSVLFNNSRVNFIHTDHFLRLRLPSPLAAGSIGRVTVWYHGIAAATAETDYHGLSIDTLSHLSTLTSWSEPFFTNLWYPSKMLTQDKADSVTVIVTVPGGLNVLSNGLLTDSTAVQGGKIRYTWKSHYPTAYYLVSVAVGPYSRIKMNCTLPGSGKTMPLEGYLINTLPEYQLNLQAMERTKDWISNYSTLLGEFPFSNEKYSCAVFLGPWGAMENQTCTYIGYSALDTGVSIIYSYRLFYAPHELAHSWFGDMVTCGNWQHVWLNEGFATYCEYLLLEKMYSAGEAMAHIRFLQSSVTNNGSGSVYIPAEELTESRIFDNRLSYNKGAAILHVLRSIVNNDSLFFKALNTYLQRYKYSTAITEDLQGVFESITGKDLSYFFKQWFYGQGYPRFTIRWKQYGDYVSVISNQNGSNAATPLFQVPFEIQLKNAQKDTLIRLDQKKNIDTFSVRISFKADTLKFDPNSRLIKSVLIITGTKDAGIAPITDELYNAWPNPFNAQTRIRFRTGTPANVTVTIYNILGQRINTLWNSFTQAGEHDVIWDASALPTGVYLCEFNSGALRQVNKIILLR